MSSERAAKNLIITNATENNLKNVTLDIPHDEFTVVTGLSGSGKSSLAFDTVYAEGQRRYIETFSPYTRQFFDKVKKPHVDSIQNVRPAIAIQQRTRVTNSRSTVGSLTNILDYLKILWSNIATPVCPVCGEVLTIWKPETLAIELQNILSRSADSKFMICSQVSYETKTLKGELLRLSTLGFSRIYRESDSSILELETAAPEDLKKEKRLIVILDRLSGGKAPAKDGLRDTIEQAFSLSSGSCILIEKNSANKKDRLSEYRNVYSCSKHEVSISKPTPALFSFNHPLGACPECKGFGRILKIDMNLCVPNPNLSIKEKALQCWAGESTTGIFGKLLSFCAEKKIPTNVPWREIPQKSKDEIFNHKSSKFNGVHAWFKKLEKKAYKMHVRVFLSRYRKQVVCPECHGSRLKSSALAYQVEGKTLPDTLTFPIEELLNWIKSTKEQFEKRDQVSRELEYVFNSLLARLECLFNLGLPYLTLDRQARTLSGGETQRVNLATAIGSELINTQFVLDEPSVGLHSRDTKQLIKTLQDLQKKQNSLLVVEHDLECIEQANHIIEIGPKAGQAGGEIVFNDSAEKWKRLKVNYDLIHRDKKEIDKKNVLKIKKAGARNLKSINLDIPLNSFVCLSGVSGSGKSSLAHEVIKNSYEQNGRKEPDGIVSGWEKVSNLLFVDQSALSKTPRANIATYTKIWEEIRNLLASTDDAKLRAVNKSNFSFNVDGGRCPACKGAGYITEDMQFLSDVYVQCDICLGRRFQEKILEIKYKGFNTYEFLQMSVDNCMTVFSGHARIHEACSLLKKLGLSHLTLGHPLSELSGGEAQRLKLVPVLQEAGYAESLLIFDEPTTGLHLYDVENLIELFRFLRDKGHSILCIEHNLALLAASDWIIDLGPEGGDKGGSVMAEGQPLEIVKTKNRCYTAEALKDFLDEKDTPRPKKINAPALIRGKELQIIGAKEHNLKNIDISIPLNQMVALTGVSGSGKSSIAKDIIYAEGQRRFLDCLSPYARQFIKELKRPNIEHLENIMPTICVYQHTFQPSRLSTVATMSEVYNLLRLLYSKIGDQFCPDHPDVQISPLSAEEISRHIKSYKTTSLRILAPVIKLKKGHHNEVFQRAIESEITEVRADGLFSSPSKFLDSLDRRKPHSIDFVIGKFNPQNLDLDMIQDAVKQAFSLAGGTLIVHANNKEEIFSMDRTCAVCRRGFFKPDPEDLSFNSKRGVCKTCEGTGANKAGKACPICEGTRLNAIGSNIRLKGKNIHEACLLPAPELKDFLLNIEFDTKHAKISNAVFSEMLAKLDTLSNIGLEYLVLDRDCTTLSSGELQRLRLATAMGSPLTGVMYIFDEPSAGLHPQDNFKVIKKLSSIKDQGNSIIVIEHDINNILASDHVIDIGPGGGANGGEVMYNGDIKNFLKSSKSETAQAINETHSKQNLIEKPEITFKTKSALTVEKGELNNVAIKNLKIPLSSLVSIVGVSGAGKSTLLHGIIAETIQNAKASKNSWSLGKNTIKSDLDIESITYINQKPIGVNSRSTPASYLKVWDEIRNVFASTIEAKARGWKPSHFSYNTGNGRCPDCKGQGQIKLEMNFLPDASVLCETCKGTRFRDETNSILYLGKSVSEVLNLTFEEAKPLFANHRKIHLALTLACEIGLGYLTLGQASPTLSGGESQRIKLVSELSVNKKGHTVYVLDEPTTGLHKRDVAKLLKILYQLINKGNSVIVIEHDEDVIVNSDHVIEMGPGAGENGGKIIFEGVPDKLSSGKTPWGEILKAA